MVRAVTRTSTSRADQRVWNRIEEAVDLDVIIEIDAGEPPFRELLVLVRQLLQGGALDLSRTARGG